MMKSLCSAAFVACTALFVGACGSGPEAQNASDAHKLAEQLEYTQLSDSNVNTFNSRLQDYRDALAEGDQARAESIAKSLGQSALRYRKALEDAQFDEDSARRRGISNAMLGFTGDPSVVPGLMAVARKSDEHDGVRSRAVLGLFVLGSRLNEAKDRKNIVAAIKTMMLPSEPSTSIRLNAVATYGAMFNKSLGDTIDPLQKALVDDPSPYVRGQALVALGDLAEPSSVVDIVSNGLSDAEPSIRAAAAQALGKIRSPLSLEALRRAAVDDDSGQVRAEATFALAGQTGIADDALVIDLILIGINDIDEAVRDASARAAAKLGTQEAIRPLLSLTQDTSTNVRISAIRALGEITPREKEADVMPLVSSLNDGDPFVVRAAQSSLQKVTGQNLGSSARAWTTYYEDKYPKLTGKDYSGPLPPVGAPGAARNSSSRRTTSSSRTSSNRNTSNRNTRRTSTRR